VEVADAGGSVGVPSSLSVLLGVSARKPAVVIGGARVRGSFHVQLALGRAPGLAVVVTAEFSVGVVRDGG